MVVRRSGVVLRLAYLGPSGQNRTDQHGFRHLPHHHCPRPPTPAPDPHTDRPSELPPNAGRAATGIAIVLVAQLMLVLDATVVNVALPRIDADLGFGPASLSWVLNAYTLAFGGLLMLGGRLGDVRGRLRLFETGLTLFTLASVLGGLAQTPASWSPPAPRRASARPSPPPACWPCSRPARPTSRPETAPSRSSRAVSSGGASLGLLLGGLVTDVGSWRWTLFINVPIGLAVLLLAPRFVAETKRRPGRFDVVGAATATLGAVSLVWALIGTPEHGWTSARTVLGFAAGLALLGVLAVTERRVAHPLIRPALLRSRRRVAALVVMALVVGGQLSMFFLVVQYVQRVLGFGPLASGFAFLPLSLGIFTMSRVTPRLVALAGPGALIMVGTLGLTTSFVLLSGVGAGDSYLGAVFGPMLLNGLSAGLVFMPVTATALAAVEPEHAGSASGLLQTTQQLGSAVGVAAIVSVYAAGAVPGEFLPGVRAAFLTSAAFALVAFAVATLVLRPRRATGLSSPEPVAAPEPAEPLAAGGGRRRPATRPRPGGDSADGRADQQRHPGEHQHRDEPGGGAAQRVAQQPRDRAVEAACGLPGRAAASARRARRAARRTGRTTPWRTAGSTRPGRAACGGPSSAGRPRPRGCPGSRRRTRGRGPCRRPGRRAR